MTCRADVGTIPLGGLATGGERRTFQAMPKLTNITLDALTEEAFRPFGHLVAKPAGPSLGERAVQDYWRLPFELDGKPELEIVRYWQQPWEFEALERHLHVTESRVALGQQAAILAVAPATPPGDRTSFPDPDSIRAFLLDGSVGVILHRGTWHALDCFPVRAPFVDFAFLTEAETVAELEGAPTIAAKPRTQVADFGADRDLRFRIVDPEKLV